MYVKNIYKALSFACAINKRERAHKHTRTAFSQLFARFLGFFFIYLISIKQRQLFALDHICNFDIFLRAQLSAFQMAPC